MNRLCAIPPRRAAALVGLALALFAAELDAQRGRGFRRGRRGPPPQIPPPAKSTEKKKVEHWLAITGGKVHVGTGQILRRATVLIGDDKIHAVGHDVELPEGAEILDARGKVVAPGFVAVRAAGMGAPGRISGKARDSLNPFDPSIRLGLSAGITAFLATFETGSTAPGGKNAVLKLAYGDLDGMVVAENTVRTMRVPLSASQMRSLEDLVKKARKHLEAVENYETAAEKGEKGKQRPKPDRSIQGILPVLRGKARLWISCSGRYDVPAIRQALAISRLIGHGVVLDSPLTAWVIPDEVASTGSMAIVLPRQRVAPDPARPDETGSNLAQAAILAGVGVPVAVLPAGGRFGGSTPRLGTGGILGQDLHTLNLDAAFAVRGGMDEHKALRTIALDAARILGVEDRLGSLEKGKDADLLILDGDPLHYKTFVLKAIVNGKVVYEKQKEPFYRHIVR